MALTPTLVHQPTPGGDMSTAVHVLCPRCNMVDVAFFRCTTCRYFPINQPELPTNPTRLYDSTHPDHLFPRDGTWQHDTTEEGGVERNPGPRGEEPPAKRARHNEELPANHNPHNVSQKRLNHGNNEPNTKRRKAETTKNTRLWKPTFQRMDLSSPLPPHPQQRDPTSPNEAWGSPQVKWTYQPLLTTHDHTNEVYVEHPLYAHALTQDAHNTSTTQPRTETPSPIPGLLWAPIKASLFTDWESKLPCQVFGVATFVDFAPPPPPAKMNAPTEHDPNATERGTQTVYETPTATGWMTPREVSSQPPGEQLPNWTISPEECLVCMDLPPSVALPCEPRHRLCIRCAGDERTHDPVSHVLVTHSTPYPHVPPTSGQHDECALETQIESNTFNFWPKIN